MITLTNVTKRFGESQAVDGISIKINPGEIVGLLGPNGAGKTTTLRMIAGVLPPSSGKLKFDGKNYFEHEYAIRKRIGYLPENNPLYEEMTVEEHLQFFADLKGITEGLVEKIEYAVNKTGIDTVYYRPISELSKGYQQRVGLAQAILAQPEILLLDEPTEGLDPNQRRDIQRLLGELKEGRTVIVSSHVLGEISKLANRIVIINQGKIVGDDSPKQLVTRNTDLNRLEVEIVGKGVAKGLKTLKGVVEVNKGGEAHMYELVVNVKKDIREAVFDLAVKHKWKLLMMVKRERQLEDVFSELTETKE
jgi:ABC-2 type transport system ATP-binding protein